MGNLFKVSNRRTQFGSTLTCPAFSSLKIDRFTLFINNDFVSSSKDN